MEYLGVLERLTAISAQPKKVTSRWTTLRLLLFGADATVVVKIVSRYIYYVIINLNRFKQVTSRVDF